MKKNTWLLLALCLPILGLSQGVKNIQFDKFLKKQRIEMEPVHISGLPPADQLTIDFTAISSDLFLSLRGVGWGASTVDKENELILFFSNDSTITLKTASLQSFEPGLTEHTYRHHYILNFQHLSALSNFDLVGLRKYSFNTYSDLRLPAGNAEAIKETSVLFLAELKKANITNAVKQINVKDIRNYIGDSISFCSKVYRTRYFKESEEGPTLLDVQADFSDPFVNVVILEKDRATFGNTPEDVYLNKDVCITGVVRLRNNVPYLVVQNDGQLRLNNLSPAPSVTTLANERKDKPISTSASEIRNETVARANEALAEFPGGADAFLSYLDKNLLVPTAVKTKKSKQVIATFIIDAQGNCGGIKILESGGNAVDEEVKKVLLRMPKWKPAFSNGRFIATRITQPITIKGV